MGGVRGMAGVGSFRASLDDLTRPMACFPVKRGRTQTLAWCCDPKPSCLWGTVAQKSNR